MPANEVSRFQLESSGTLSSGASTESATHEDSAWPVGDSSRPQRVAGWGKRVRLAPDTAASSGVRSHTVDLTLRRSRLPPDGRLWQRGSGNSHMNSRSLLRSRLIRTTDVSIKQGGSPNRRVRPFLRNSADHCDFPISTLQNRQLLNGPLVVARPET